MIICFSDELLENLIRIERDRSEEIPSEIGEDPSKNPNSIDATSCLKSPKVMYLTFIVIVFDVCIQFIVNVHKLIYQTE